MAGMITSNLCAPTPALSSSRWRSFPPKIAIRLSLILKMALAGVSRVTKMSTLAVLSFLAQMWSAWPSRRNTLGCGGLKLLTQPLIPLISVVRPLISIVRRNNFNFFGIYHISSVIEDFVGSAGHFFEQPLITCNDGLVVLLDRY